MFQGLQHLKSSINRQLLAHLSCERCGKRIEYYYYLLTIFSDLSGMNYHLQYKRLSLAPQQKDQEYLMSIENVLLFLEVILYTVDYLWERLKGKKIGLLPM